MLEVQAIHRHYAEFDLNVSFEVQDGEILTLLGASGSGKTTSLRIVAGFEHAESGRILVDGKDIQGVPAQQRNIGYVFQDYTLFPHLNVAENIAYGLRARHTPSSMRTRRVAELLELVGLDDFGSRAVQTLSGGEQQRVAVARALACEPRALLLDEPFSAIDTERREELRRQLVKLQRRLGIPMIFVTHSRSEALYISDRIVVLRNGTVVDSGTPEQLYERPRCEYSARFIGRANILKGEDIGARNGATYLIRPEHLRLRDTGSTKGGLVLEATSRESAYYGSEREHLVETAIGNLSLVSPGVRTLPQHFQVELPHEFLVELAE
ncbi:MAG: ABC transporter ATP-binding protein [Spirochaeta sp.]|nr:ABC transporter ATP-binding protein [Spirochaeta sp.]